MQDECSEHEDGLTIVICVSYISSADNVTLFVIIEIDGVWAQRGRPQRNWLDDVKEGTNLDRNYWNDFVMSTFKVLPYSLPSVGPGVDPRVQTVSPQVTF